MKPVMIEGMNVILKKPEGWADEECGEIAVLKTDTPRGPSYIVAFKPSAADLFALNAGQPVLVRVTGGLFPPMAVFTTDPATGDVNFEEDPT